MSLLVWFPFTNAPMRANQGISNVYANHMGSSFNPGKVGFSTYFDKSSSQYSRINMPGELSSIKNSSVCAWLKVASSGNCYLGGISHDTGTTAPTMTLCNSGWQFAGSSWIYVSAGSIAVNKWYHVCCTCSNDTVTTYLNGTKVTSNTLSALGVTRTEITSDNFIEIGCDHPGGDEYLDGYVQDFRVYNHCLSPYEVKQISLGLCGHYTLDYGSGLIGNRNLAKNSMFRTFSKTYNIANFSTEEIEAGVTYTATILGKTYGNVTFGLWMGGGYTDCGRFSLVRSGHTYNIYKLTFTGPTSIAGDGNRTRINIYSYPSSAASSDGATINWLKLEEGDKSTPWMPHDTDGYSVKYGYTNKREEDSSGYGYHGLHSNTTYKPSIGDCPVLGSCRIFDSSGDPFKIPLYQMLGQTSAPEWSMAVWFYKSAVCTGWESILGGSFELDAGNGSYPNHFYIHSWGGGTYAYQLNTWYHIVFVRTESDSKLYVNGSLALTGTAGRTTAADTDYFVGAWTSYTSQTLKNAKLSDMRFYATPLSADDVKDLYNSYARLDQNGQFYAHEFREYVDKQT